MKFTWQETMETLDSALQVYLTAVAFGLFGLVVSCSLILTIDRVMDHFWTLEKGDPATYARVLEACSDSKGYEQVGAFMYNCAEPDSW